MPGTMQKIKLLKLYELLRRETDEDDPISRKELCKRLKEMGISSKVRTLSLDIRELTENGYEIVSFMRAKERFYFIPEHALSIPEIKIIIDALQAASFVTEKKTVELIGKIAAIAGSHQADLIALLCPLRADRIIRSERGKTRGILKFDGKCLNTGDPFAA